MKIGISINNVLRDYFLQLEEVYDKYFPPEEESEGMEVNDYDLEKWITFPIEEVSQGELEFNPDFNEDSFMESDETTEVVETKNQVTLEEFLYEKCTLEIFGYAPEVTGTMDVINNLILENPNIEFVIMSREIGLSIPSTFFFLSKTSCMSQNIKFVKEYKDHWNHVDIMVTDHPEILSSMPTNNKQQSIKVNRDYNTESLSSYSIDSVHGLPELLETIKED
jgi:hypothetical protein